MSILSAVVGRTGSKGLSMTSIPPSRNHLRSSITLTTPHPLFLQHSKFSTFQYNKSKTHFIRNQNNYLSHTRHYAIGDMGVSKLNMFDSAGLIQIERYSDDGFTILGRFYDHSLIIFSDFVVKWNVYSVEDFTPEKFELITHFHPALDTVVIGTGESIEQISPELKAYFEENKMRYEVLDSKNAVTTFNFMQLEGRRAVAAVVPINSSKMREKYPSYH